MEMTPENLTRHELIGLAVEVADSTNPSLTGISGRVVDETRNTLVVETKDGEKRVPKACARFTFTLPDGRRARVEGLVLESQPENRINKRVKRWKL
jgi:ribonuclease P protein subunit POP4